MPRNQIRSAARLEMVGSNLSRAAGPALAGLIIPKFGVPTVFALNALSVIPLAVALLFWHRVPTVPAGGRERFVPALRAGGQYVWHDTSVRRILVRLAIFLLPASVLWVLLPLVATRQLGVGPGGYGLMFAAVGVGAVGVGAVGVGAVGVGAVGVGAIAGALLLGRAVLDLDHLHAGGGAAAVHAALGDGARDGDPDHGLHRLSAVRPRLGTGR